MVKLKSKILFVIGPSGVGKTTICNYISHETNYCHIDLDIDRPFKFYDFQQDWEDFTLRNDPGNLVTKIEVKISSEKCYGAILSFPSTRIITLPQIEIANSVGISTILLWCKKEHCMQSRKQRDSSDEITFYQKRYDRSNNQAFKTYGSEEFDLLRINVFQNDGSYIETEKLLAEIVRISEMNTSLKL